jgi:hypothetical protein
VLQHEGLGRLGSGKTLVDPSQPTSKYRKGTLVL